MTHRKFRDPLQDIRVSKVFQQRVVPEKREPKELFRMDDICTGCYWEIDDCCCGDSEAYEW